MNREQIISNVRIYADNHKVQISQKSKLYRVLNKEQITINKTRLYVCECGREISHHYKSDHLKTKIHNDLMLSKNVTPLSV
jgi:hypothetical protein